MNLSLFLIFATCIFTQFQVVLCDQEMWSKDMTNEIEIGPADSGYKEVHLRCIEQKRIFQVNIELDEDFSGVIYTRGSYASKDKDCFLHAKAGRKFRMKIPFDKCGTKREGDIFKTVLIVQYDEFLIMPGDAAFELECNVGPIVAEVTVDSAISTQPQVRKPISKISLADADPSGKPLPRHRQSVVTGEEGEVSFTPDDVRPRKKKKGGKEHNTKTVKIEL
ncbi:uncharacterized protein LOC135946799 [Cloeon dipterum]|uniref:uncharacterized protein LOC135946799 n=1 Tax=Cloeon dipterum TaxID=197152 RepID=UPI0032202563